MKLKQHELEVVATFIGSTVSNQNGDLIGFVSGLFNTRKNENADYIILGCDLLFGNSTRFFAIPASSQMIEVTNENISVKIDKDHLMQAKRIPLDKCPKPHFDLDPLIYELTDYRKYDFQSLKRV